MPAPRFSSGGLPRSDCSTNLEHVYDEVIQELRHRVAAVTGDSTTAAGEVLPVVPPLAAVLPRGGIARGSVVSVLGHGATSLLFTLLAGPQAPWSALVGMPDIGLLAAAEFGIDLDRVVVIPEPGPDVLQVLSILIDGVDMIAVALPAGVLPAASRQRVLTGRLRQHGAVLLVMGPWPGADVVLTARWVGWTGLGRGHGRLRDRELVVEVAGRGVAAGRGIGAALLLRADRTAISVTASPVIAISAAAGVGARTRTESGAFEPVADVG
jgi:hypothetical protein